METPRILRLTAHKRDFSVLPHVSGVMFADSQTLLPSYRAKDIQYCLRLSSRTKQIETVIDGVPHLLTVPHYLMKIPESFYEHPHPYCLETFFFSYALSEKDILTRSGFFNVPAAGAFPMTPRIGGILRELRELAEHSHDIGAADRIDLCCFQLLEECCFEHQSASRQTRETMLRRAAAYLDAHFAENPDYDELARETGCSRSTFLRQWHALFGMSPNAYCQRCKRWEAERLLAETTLSLEEITARLGYAGVSHFCARFRAWFGETPLKFRKKRQSPG